MQVRDAMGIGLSGACVVHCLALPVLVSVTPALVPLQNEFTPDLRLTHSAPED